MDGWFSINRNLLSSSRWLSEPFTRAQAWVDLIGLAKHKPGFVRIRGIRVDLQRGQLAWSQLSLSKRWQWSRNKTRRYLNELEKHQDIEQQNNEVTTVITILKYDYWQSKDTTSGTTSDTTEGQQKDNRRYTNNKDNKDNKENKTPPTPSKGDSMFDEFWREYPKKVGKGAARKAWGKIRGIPKADIIEALKSQVNQEQWQKENGRFIPNPATWINQERWEDDVGGSNDLSVLAKKYNQ